MRDDDGAIVGAATIARDITHVKRLEQQLRQAQKMEAIGRLSGGVAHDFNNLLTGIIGYAMLAMDRPGGTAVRDELEEIVKAGERAAELTRQLLAFSRQQPVEVKVLSLNDAIAAIERMLRRLVGEDVELTCRLAPDLCPIVADVTQLHQIMLNLAANARDAMPEGGTLTIETATVELDDQYAAAHTGVSAGTHAVLTVTDSGVGIDPADRDRVFEPFFTTKPPGAGTGLGLATVFGIVEQNHGHVWVYSEPGHGACFKIYLPAAEEPRGGPAARRRRRRRWCPPRTPRSSSSRTRSSSGCSPPRCSGTRATTWSPPRTATWPWSWRRRGTRRFDVVVTDIVMPGMRGTEVVERLGTAACAVHVGLHRRDVRQPRPARRGGAVPQQAVLAAVAARRRPADPRDARRRD